MQNEKNRFRHLTRVLGPGLLFASSAIGTSHLVYSTKAGAHHGLIFFWVIAAALLFKYPFFEFGPRYANATGHSLLKGYRDQGKWAIILYLLIISFSMFAVVGAVGALSAALFQTMLGTSLSIPDLTAGILLLTAILLLVGRYSALDNFIKIISVVLLVTVVTALVAVLFKGPVASVEGFSPDNNIFKGVALALVVSLIGWMPTGMEASTMHSIWVVEKERTTGYKPTLKEALFDFNLGYVFTIIIAFMFLIIGAFTLYGTGEKLEGTAGQFSIKLIGVFVENLGEWTFPVISIAAFGTIYGTLITAWDAFARGFVRTLRIFKFKEMEHSEEQLSFLQKGYNYILPIIGLGGYLLFTQYSKGMINMLDIATTFSFLAAPIIGFLNLKAIQSHVIPESHQPTKMMIGFSYLGLVVLTLFAFYYVF
jgi:Mn2+/Fe2+ NRAMP family transporter